MDIFVTAMEKIQSLAVDDLEHAYVQLKLLFGEEKGRHIESFWKLAEPSRKIVWKRATSSELKESVKGYLRAAGKPTAACLQKHYEPDTEGKPCLDNAPIHNTACERMFGMQDEAGQSTKGKHNRIRGVALSKLSGTFTTVKQKRTLRRKKFMKMVRRDRAQMIDWVEDHKSDQGFLSHFNRKRFSVRVRRRCLIGWGRWEKRGGKWRLLVGACMLTPPLPCL